MHKGLALLALFALVSCAGAQAVYVDVPATIVVQQAQKDVPLKVTNDSEEALDYGIRLIGPVNAVITPSYGTIGAGKTVVASFSILPQEGLEGTTYENTLEVRVGGEKAFRKISVVFKEAQEQSPEPEPAPIGLFSLAYLGAFYEAVFTPENILNAFLAVAAAILLIAFIARFVKRLEAQK